MPESERSGAQSIDSLLRKIAELVSSGVDWIQIREKDLSAKELARLVREALQIARSSSDQTRPTRILINDRLDVALAEGADGVHLPGNSLRPSEARELLKKRELARTRREDFLVGISCHSKEDAKTAAGADYIFLGPVFATPSKAPFGAPQGLDRLAEICLTVSIPVIAIGGITLENAASCLSAGAAGIAAIRLFQDAPIPKIAVESLRNSTNPLSGPQE